MENTTELTENRDRDYEATTWADSIDNSGDSTEAQLDILSSEITWSGREKCTTEQVTSNLEGRTEDYVEADNLNETQSASNFKITMLLRYSKEFLGFFALIFTTYATLLNKEHIIGGTLSPKPIFPSDSLVQEWPYGQLVDVQSRVAVSELSLIFFYAPWCAESLSAKDVFNTVATIYSKEAYFAAINCWQPGSSCRTNYSNVYRWPVVMAYLPNALSVQYNGPWSYNSLAAFINGLLTPVVRVHSKDELMQLRLTNDAVLFGVFTSTDSKEYQIFFQTAIKWLESISFQNAKFAVYTGLETSMFLQSQQAPVMKLLTLNETIVYNDKRWVPRKILGFLKRHLAQSSIWLNLSNSKSTIVHSYLRQGPVLLMFSPRVSLSPHYFIMRQIVYLHKHYQHDLNNSVLNEYIDCVQKGITGKPFQYLTPSFERFLVTLEYSAKSKMSTRYCDFLINRRYKDVRTEFNYNEWRKGLLSLSVQLANTSKHDRVRMESCDYNYCDDNLFNQQMHKGVWSNRGLFEQLDYRSPEGLLRKHLQKECVHLERLPSTLYRESNVTPVDSSKLLDIEVPHNESLTFLMLDSVEYSDYIQHLIGDHEGLVDSSALFIIDTEKEALYRQKGPISTSSAIEFVRSYYNDKLQRHLRSFAEAKSNHFPTSSVVSIREISSKQFSKIIKSPHATSVVLFYSPNCLLCSLMSHALLHVSNVLNLKNVNFYRIDGSANDFSWEYAMDKYPTLIVFLRNRSMDTSVFPSSLEISVKNVFGFILSKLKPEQQLKSLANACVSTKISNAFQACVRHVREMITSEISHYLHQWNQSKDNRSLILRRLQILSETYWKLVEARQGSDLEFISDIFIYENGHYLYAV